MIKINPSIELLSDLAEKLDMDSEKPGQIITAALKHAFSQNLTPGLCDQRYLKQGAFQAFRINPMLTTKLNNSLAEYQSLDSTATLASITLGLLCATAKVDQSCSTGRAITKEEPWSNWLKAAGLTERPEQIRLIRESEYQLGSKRDAIVMAEASVGVGKSFAIVCSALQSILNGEKRNRVIIAGPTYQIAKQLLQSANILITSNQLEDIKITLIRSRAEFISAGLMDHHLKNESSLLDPDLVESARKLLDKNEFRREVYEKIGLDCHRLILPLINDPDDDAEDQYLALRTDASGCDMVFCTHAMLAAHIASTRQRVLRLTKPDSDVFSNYTEVNEFIEAELQNSPILASQGILPEVDLLFVDEAHKLEETYRSLQSRKISLGAFKKSIRECVKEKLISKTQCTEAIQVIEDFQTKISLVTGSVFPSKYTSEFFDTISPILQFRKKRIVSKYGLFVQEELDSLRELATSNDRSHTAYISPVRKALSIQNTTRKPSSWLDMTWRLTPKALLLSGTLTTGGSDASYGMMGIKCCVTTSRLCSVGPIETSWLRKEVTLHAPLLSNSQREAEALYEGTLLFPPKEQTKPKMKAWCEGQAQYIYDQQIRTTGGGIIFCTSYDQVGLLHHAMEALSHKNKNIVLLRSIHGTGMNTIIEKYKQAYFNGLQPLWVAISSVGTGVDITDNDSPPNEDNMVQSIFITRVPHLITNNSNQGGNSSNFLSMIRESMILTKQMIGRLVRRPGRTKMHIHLMDTRFSIKKGHYRMYSQIIDKYTDTEIIESNR